MLTETIISTFAQELFGAICHGEPAITGKLEGHNLLLCPRCTGLHLGFVVTLFYLILSRKRDILFTYNVVGLIVLTIAILPLEWSLSLLGWFDYSSSYESRIWTGLACGSALAILFHSYVHSLVKVSIALSPKPVRVTTIGILLTTFYLGWTLIASWVFITLLQVILVLTTTAFALSTALLRMVQITGNLITNFLAQQRRLT